MSRHKLDADPTGFVTVADYIITHYGQRIVYIADVGGRQGVLARALSKKHNYECEVIDPHGCLLKSIKCRKEEYNASFAPYYDLIVGIHCHETLREVVTSALARPVLLVPCCNYWSEEKLAYNELVEAIESYYQSNFITFERVTFQFKGPENIGLVSEPPRRKANN